MMHMHETRLTLHIQPMKPMCFFFCLVVVMRGEIFTFIYRQVCPAYERKSDQN